MSNIKISQLPVASTPAGTEVLPIVQSSTTKQIALDTAYASSTGAGWVGFNPATSSLAATTVQGAIDEIVSDLAAPGGAALVGNTPAGTISATTVQGAIDEIVSDLAAANGASLIGYTGPAPTSAVTTVDQLAATGTNKGADLVGFLQAGTNAVPTTVQAKLRETVSVLDFGADPTGNTDSTQEIQDALDSGAKSVFIPDGIFLSGKLTLPNNVTLYGNGPGSVLRVKASNNDTFLLLTGTAGVRLYDFKIDGNEGSQASGDVVFGTGVSDLECRNVVVVDPHSWSFAFYGSSDNLRFYGCHSINGRAGANANAVRAGFLFGASGTSSEATNVLCDGCTSVSTSAFRNGFMSEWGSQHQFIGCRTSVAYTGFKIKAHRVTVTGCYATGGTQGFQTQQDIIGLTMTGNTAYRCGDSGFFFAVPSGTAKSWVVCGNNAIENGQSPLSSSYGFNFDPTAGATLDGLVFTGNSAVDTQGVKTQTRGVSFGANGTISNVMYGNNSSLGNTVDVLFGAALQVATLLKTFNRATAGSSSNSTAYPTSVHRLQFWTDNLPASSGTVTLSSGFGGRGYMMPKAGFIRLVSVKGNATTTAGNATFQLRINGSINSSFNTQINTTNPTLATTEVAVFSNTFAAGDMITMSCVGDASLSPSGTTDFDVVVEVCY